MSKNEDKHEQKNQRVKAAGAGPEREGGWYGGGAMGPDGVRHARHETVFLLTHYFENELKERTNELTPLAAYLKLV